MSKKTNNKSVNNNVDRSDRPLNESASASPSKKPERSKLDDYNPPARKKKD